MKELVDQLVKGLKIDERQARGGAAVLLKAARDKLGAQDFSTMLGGLGGVDELIRQAPQQYLWAYNRYKPPRPAAAAPERAGARSTT